MSRRDLIESAKVSLYVECALVLAIFVTVTAYMAWGRVWG